jgi:pimeloyl-ACP methyl ester carboxylesterase
MRVALASIIAALWCMLAGEARALDLVTITDAGTDSAIVFIHGYGGHWKTTFEKAGKIVRCADTKKANAMSWACILEKDRRPLVEGKELSEFSVFSVDYGSLNKNSIPDVAKRVARLLEERQIFHKYNHIWFVAHSLGGLVTKRMVLALDREEKQRYINRIAGITLFAVPSRGTRLADSADNRFVKWVMEWFGNNTRILADMRSISSNSFLEALEADWVAFVGQDRNRPVFPWRPAVHCAFERAKVGAIVTVVSQEEARTSCTEAAVELDRDHFEIVKPDGPGDPVHLWLRENVAKSYLRAKRAPFATVEVHKRSLQSVLSWIKEKSEGKGALDEATLLPELAGAVELVSGSEKLADELLLDGGSYGGATTADLVERIAEANRCIVVQPSKNRQRTTVRVDAEKIQRCADGAVRCSSNRCG